MNPTEQLAEKLAVVSVAEKYAFGNGGNPLTFTSDVEALKEAILNLAATFGKEPAPAKPAKKPRKQAVVSAVQASSLSPEAIAEYLADGNRRTVQEAAAHFNVSVGIAKRALKALGSRVVHEKGPKDPGKRGKAPTVYSLA
jgi:ribosomal protein S25